MISNTFKSYSKKDKKITKAALIILAAVFGLKLINGFYNLIIPEKETLKLANYSENKDYNPVYFSIDKTSSDLSTLTQKKLIKYNPESKTFESDLVDFLVEDEARRFKILLKQDQIWSDNSKITADDIIFTINEIYKNPAYNNVLIRENFKNTTLKKINENEIEIKIPESNTFFVSNLEVPIFSETDFKDQNFNDLTYKNIKSSSIFKIKNIENENEVQIYELQTNKKIAKKEKAKIKNIEYHSISDKNYLIENIDEFDEITGNNIEDIENTKISKSVSLPRYQAVFFNIENSILKNINIRNALDMAANKKVLKEKLENKTIIANPFFQFDSIKTIPETKTSIIKQLLIENGLQEVNQKLTYNGNEVKLTITYPEYKTNPLRNKDNEIVIKHLIESYKKIGIELIPQKYEISVFQTLLLNKEYDLLLYGQDLGNNFDAYSFWHSSQSGKNRLNLSNLKDPLIDNLLINIRKSENQNDLIKNIQTLNKKIKELHPAIFLYTENNTILIDKRVKNRKIISDYTNLSQRLSSINKWLIQ